MNKALRRINLVTSPKGFLVVRVNEWLKKRLGDFYDIARVQKIFLKILEMPQTQKTQLDF